jgi:hypothetical protein
MWELEVHLAMLAHSNRDGNSVNRGHQTKSRTR